MRGQTLKWRQCASQDQSKFKSTCMNLFARNEGTNKKSLLTRWCSFSWKRVIQPSQWTMWHSRRKNVNLLVEVSGGSCQGTSASKADKPTKLFLGSSHSLVAQTSSFILSQQNGFQQTEAVGSAFGQIVHSQALQMETMQVHLGSKWWPRRTGWQNNPQRETILLCCCHSRILTECRGSSGFSAKQCVAFLSTEREGQWRRLPQSHQWNEFCHLVERTVFAQSFKPISHTPWQHKMSQDAWCIGSKCWKAKESSAVGLDDGSRHENLAQRDQKRSWTKKAKVWIETNCKCKTVHPAEAAGHQVVFAPPCHHNSQPFELMWALIKGNVGRQCSTDSILDKALQHLDNNFQTNGWVI